MAVRMVSGEGELLFGSEVQEPPPRGPRDVPDLRGAFIDHWSPGGRWQRAFAALGHDITDPDYWAEPRLEFGGRGPGSFDRTNLPDATLWWVSEDMVDLVDHAARSLDPVVLTAELPPVPCGLVILAKPLLGCDTNPDHADEPVEVQALLWGPIHIKVTHRVELGISMYARSVGFWYPLGRTDWRFGHDFDQPIEDHEMEPQVVRSQAEDRRWLTALWLLASQTNVATTETLSPERAIARRSHRRGLGSNVNVIDVRRRRTVVSDTGEHHEVAWSRRWIVEGFWRNQPYGPGRSLRRRQWIDPYMKGPSDKPLVVRDTVRVVR